MTPSKEALALDAAHRALREALDTPREHEAYRRLQEVAASINRRAA